MKTWSSGPLEHVWSVDYLIDGSFTEEVPFKYFATSNIRFYAGEDFDEIILGYILNQSEIEIEFG